MKKTLGLLLFVLFIISGCKKDKTSDNNPCELLNVPPEVNGWTVEQKNSATTFSLPEHFFHAVDASDVYGIQMDRMVHSTDGGQQWQDVPGYPWPLQGTGLTFNMAPDNTFFVLYDSASATSTHQFLVVGPNLGQTFAKRPVTHDGILVKLEFLDNMNGFAIEYRPGGFGIVRTADGGLTWSKVQGADFTEANSFYRLEFKTPMFGYAFLGQSNYAYVTNDGGLNWQKVTAGLLDAHTTFYFRDKDLVFAFDVNKTVRSADGGVSWQTIAEYPINVLTMKGDRGIATLRDPDCPNIGAAQAFATTEDGGLTWTRTQHSTVIQVNSGQEIAPGQFKYYNTAMGAIFTDLTIN
jgi:photosystem II stability/assembly factor-like uncharacterized protein